MTCTYKSDMQFTGLYQAFLEDTFVQTLANMVDIITQERGRSYFGLLQNQNGHTSFNINQLHVKMMRKIQGILLLLSSIFMCENESTIPCSPFLPIILTKRLCAHSLYFSLYFTSNKMSFTFMHFISANPPASFWAGGDEVFIWWMTTNGSCCKIPSIDVKFGNMSAMSKRSRSPLKQIASEK